MATAAAHSHRAHDSLGCNVTLHDGTVSDPARDQDKGELDREAMCACVNVQTSRFGSERDTQESAVKAPRLTTATPAAVDAIELIIEGCCGAAAAGAEVCQAMVRG